MLVKNPDFGMVTEDINIDWTLNIRCLKSHGDKNLVLTHQKFYWSPLALRHYQNEHIEKDIFSCYGLHLNVKC